VAGSIRIGVVGCGYWGPNHIRVFSTLSRLGAKMAAAAAATVAAALMKR